jgi:terminase small subunit / prophage DNA-packing protein
MKIFAISAISELTGRDRRSLIRILGKHVPKPATTERGAARYSMEQVLDAFVAETRGRAPKKGEKVSARELLLHEQTVQKRRENELAAGGLLNAADVERAWSEILKTVRIGMLAVPQRVAQRLSHLTRQDISELDLEVREVLKQIGNDEKSQIRDLLAA